MSSTKERRSSHAKSLRKYTPEERREREKKHHEPVEREHFEEVIRRLIAVPSQKTKKTSREKRR